MCLKNTTVLALRTRFRASLAVVYPVDEPPRSPHPLARHAHQGPKRSWQGFDFYGDLANYGRTDTEPQEVTTSPEPVRSS